MNTKRTLSITQTEKKYFRGLIFLAGVLFSVGIFLPLITFSKLIVFKSSISIISGIIELINNGQFILFILIAGFSIVLPLMKIGVLWQIVNCNKMQSDRLNTLFNLMHDYGRWAMLDVMVVAILIVTVKLGAIASIQAHIGLYIFGASVLLIMLITHHINKRTR